ncbi:MAG TPA: beta-propeller fold lactonase family protein [Bacteroidia bacterium]|nr:beta-propeller fold lactonase family protein [Bacteroidia bacterium]
MNSNLKFLLPVITTAIIAFSACNDDKENPAPVFKDGCYPPGIAQIMVNKCASAGCHNTISKDAASGLDLSTWELMFLGNRNGAAVVPYRSDQSTLCYFTNTDTLLGIVQLPTMPYNQPPLSQTEYLALKQWIDLGAPNCNGFVKFSDNPNRRKLYIANQGCDLVGVHDPSTKVVMRYVDVGNKTAIEAPHVLRMSPDGQYWYAAFIFGDVLQKYRTSDDQLVAEANMGPGAWNTFAISPDGTKAWVISLESNGKAAYVDLQTMQLMLTYQDGSNFASPHGSVVSPNGNFLYVTGQLGNQIYKWDVTDPMNPEYDVITIKSGLPNADPHNIIFSPDGSKYFITCQNTDEVRVFNSSDDSFNTSIPVGDFPLEFSISPSQNYLFVSNEVGNSVTVIDINTLTAIKTINVGYQPHGLAVDEVENVVYVANRNTPTSGGPAPHHTSSCGGRNGYLTIIDVNTLELVPGFKMELSVDPYSVMVRN